MVAQFLLMGAIVALGALPPRWPDPVRWLGVPLALAGAAGAVWAGRTLGRSLTPYPRPRNDGELVESGPYRLVRHPIYGAGCFFFIGYSLFASVAATGATVVLALLWWLKAGVEERLLAERFPGYFGYRRRVRGRLFPYV